MDQDQNSVFGNEKETNNSYIKNSNLNPNNNPLGSIVNTLGLLRLRLITTIFKINSKIDWLDKLIILLIFFLCLYVFRIKEYFILPDLIPFPVSNLFVINSSSEYFNNFFLNYNIDSTSFYSIFFIIISTISFTFFYLILKDYSLFINDDSEYKSKSNHLRIINRTVEKFLAFSIATLFVFNPIFLFSFENGKVEIFLSLIISPIVFITLKRLSVASNGIEIYSEGQINYKEYFSAEYLLQNNYLIYSFLLGLLLFITSFALPSMYLAILIYLTFYFIHYLIFDLRRSQFVKESIYIDETSNFRFVLGNFLLKYVIVPFLTIIVSAVTFYIRQFINLGWEIFYKKPDYSILESYSTFNNYNFDNTNFAKILKFPWFSNLNLNQFNYVLLLLIAISTISAIFIYFKSIYKINNRQFFSFTILFSFFGFILTWFAFFTQSVSFILFSLFLISGVTLIYTTLNKLNLNIKIIATILIVIFSSFLVHPFINLTDKYSVTNFPLEIMQNTNDLCLNSTKVIILPFLPYIETYFYPEHQMPNPYLKLINCNKNLYQIDPEILIVDNYKPLDEDDIYALSPKDALKNAILEIKNQSNVEMIIIDSTLNPTLKSVSNSLNQILQPEFNEKNLYFVYNLKNL
jgi:hypothetical protein